MAREGDEAVVEDGFGCGNGQIGCGPSLSRPAALEDHSPATQ